MVEGDAVAEGVGEGRRTGGRGHAGRRTDADRRRRAGGQASAGQAARFREGGGGGAAVRRLPGGRGQAAEVGQGVGAHPDPPHGGGCDARLVVEAAQSTRQGHESAHRDVPVQDGQPENEQAGEEDREADDLHGQFGRRLPRPEAHLGRAEAAEEGPPAAEHMPREAVQPDLGRLPLPRVTGQEAAQIGKQALLRSLTEGVAPLAVPLPQLPQGCQRVAPGAATVPPQRAGRRR